MIDYGALIPDSGQPAFATGLGGGSTLNLGGLMNFLRTGLGSTASGIPNAPLSQSAGAAGQVRTTQPVGTAVPEQNAGNRLFLNNTVQGYKAPGEGGGPNGGANVWFGQPNQGNPNLNVVYDGGPIRSATPNNSQAAPLGGPSGWFPGQGQGFTFFGQQTPTQVGTNQFVWGNPNIPGAGVPGGGSPSTNTSSLQNLMQLVSTLQNNMNSLQQQRTTQPVAQQTPPAPNVTSPWYANTGYQDPSVWGAGA